MPQNFRLCLSNSLVLIKCFKVKLAFPNLIFFCSFNAANFFREKCICLTYYVHTSFSLVFQKSKCVKQPITLLDGAFRKIASMMRRRRILAGSLEMIAVQCCQHVIFVIQPIQEQYLRSRASKCFLSFITISTSDSYYSKRQFGKIVGKTGQKVSQKGELERRREEVVTFQSV